ncbi:hypothetical protein ACFE04_025928 [Oxalis oulophora]
MVLASGYCDDRKAAIYEQHPGHSFATVLTHNRNPQPPPSLVSHSLTSLTSTPSSLPLHHHSRSLSRYNRRPQSIDCPTVLDWYVSRREEGFDEWERGGRLRQNGIEERGYDGKWGRRESFVFVQTTSYG